MQWSWAEIGECLTGYKEKCFPPEDSRAASEVAQRTVGSLRLEILMARQGKALSYLNTKLPLLWAEMGWWPSKASSGPDDWWSCIIFHAEIPHVGYHTRTSEAVCEGSVEMDISAGSRQRLAQRIVSDLNEAARSNLGSADISSNRVSRSASVLLRTCHSAVVLALALVHGENIRSKTYFGIQVRVK